MRTTICSLVILSLIIQMTNAAIGSSSKFRPRTNLKCESPKCPKEDDGLDLTETIKKLGVEKARELSEVSDLGNITSYSGFFTTSEIPAGNKNKMFYWYFPAQNGDKDAPLLVWLQGGPGGSSMFGLFAEMGPFTLLGPNVQLN